VATSDHGSKVTASAVEDNDFIAFAESQDVEEVVSFVSSDLDFRRTSDLGNQETSFTHGMHV
jgi:hypothetical protein